MLEQLPIKLEPHGDNWTASPLKHENAVFTGSREVVFLVGQLIALREGKPLHIYQHPKSPKPVTDLPMLRVKQKLVAQLQTRILEENVEEVALISDLLDMVEFRYHVVERDDGWHVFKLLEDGQIWTLPSQGEAIQFAYKNAREDGSIVYVYDQSDTLIQEIDPEDDLEYSEEFLASLKAVDDAGDYLSLDDFKRELGLNE